MDSAHVREKLVQFKTREQDGYKDLLAFSRVLVPILRDKGLPELAVSLEAKIFTLDAVESELQGFLRSDPKTAMLAMLEIMKASGHR